MSPKRKQPHGEAASDSPAQTPVKRQRLKLISKSPLEVTPTGAHKCKHFSSEHVDDNPPLGPAKKLKLIPDTPAAVTTKSDLRRYNTPVTGTPKSTLVPRGERRTAKLGQKDESVLRIVCDCSVTNKVTEMHFRKIPASAIDWNNRLHISKINAWRNQICGRAGLKARSVSMWHEQEELWFELYFQLSIAESRKSDFMLPATKAVREAFNETFFGKVLQDKEGNNLEPRVERQANAFASKFNRVCSLLKKQLDDCVFSRSGDVFVPKITLEMIKEYQSSKAAADALVSLANSVFA